MAQVQIADVVVPAEFTAYQVENSMVSTALFQSGVAVPNGEMQAQLEAGAESFAVPFWSDLPDVEADIINTALTIGDRLTDMKAIAMHSTIYGEALKANDIQFFKPSDNSLIVPTYKGLAVIIDDSLVTATPGVFVTILFGPGAVGFAVAPPRTGYGTELWRVPSAGNGGGQTTLHSRFDCAFHPLGFAFTGASVAGVSPLQAELALAANWTRAYSQRKSVPLAFLISN